MNKILVFLVVIWVLARLAKRWLLAKAQKMQQNLEAQLRAQMHQQMNQQMGQQTATGPGPAAGPAAAQAEANAERMVACAQCGLHIPQSEALMRAGQPYCSTAHADQAQG